MITLTRNSEQSWNVNGRSAHTEFSHSTRVVLKNELNDSPSTRCQHFSDSHSAMYASGMTTIFCPLECMMQKRKALLFLQFAGARKKGGILSATNRVPFQPLSLSFKLRLHHGQAYLISLRYARRSGREVCAWILCTKQQRVLRGRALYFHGQAKRAKMTTYRGIAR